MSAYGGHADPLLYEMSHPGRRAVRTPALDVPQAAVDAGLLREPAPLPEVSELDLVRHFTHLSQANMAIDTNFYPLGSCTMKYNPKVNEVAAADPKVAGHHPLADESQSQGILALMHDLQGLLCSISGFHTVSLQPAAGAQGELTGVLVIGAYHRSRGDTGRTKILIPDSAHGTNPATVTMAGLEAVQLPSDASGNVDLAALKAACGADVAGLMITNPNTLGLFEEHIEEVVATVHQCGGLVYGDGANLNAILGVLRPADVGIDVMHFNLHKTFSTPHGGGGPGAGPVGVTERLAQFLPGQIVVRVGDRYALQTPSATIGRLKAFHGNVGMLVRAWVYIKMHGDSGLREIAENAVLNANYLKHLVSADFPVKYQRSCMHEFVSVGTRADGISTMDVAKRLLDYGFHAPTVYFPLIVKEALMVEPTESENRETLEAFADALGAIAREAKERPELLHDAPHNATTSRLDEVKAARELILRYQFEVG